MALPTLHLHDHPLSSYASKIRIALRLKHIPYTSTVPTGLGSGQPIPSLQTANPRLEVPALVITPPNGTPFSIFDSPIILQYLEETFTSPDHRSLLPSKAEDRARARMIEALCDTHYEAINWGIGEIVFFGRAEGAQAEKLLDTARSQTKQIMAWLEEQLGSKTYFNAEGSELGYADVCVAPYVFRSWVYGMGPEEGSVLGKWLARMKEVKEVGQTFGEMQAAAERSRGLKGAFGKGKGMRREYRDHRLEWMVKSGGMQIVLDGMNDDTIRFSWPDAKL